MIADCVHLIPTTHCVCCVQLDTPVPQNCAYCLSPLHSCDQPDGGHVGRNILLIVWWKELPCSGSTYCVCVCVSAVTSNDNWSQVKPSRRAYLRSQLQLGKSHRQYQSLPCHVISAVNARKSTCQHTEKEHYRNFWTSYFKTDCCRST
jgi:hypothetical protein